MSFEWFTSCLGSRKLHQVDILGDYLRQYFTRVGKSIYRFPRSPSIITRGIAHGIRINYRLHLHCRDPGTGLGRVAMFSALAMLCKETGVTALPIMAVWSATHRRPSGASGVTKQALPLLCKYGLVVSSDREAADGYLGLSRQFELRRLPKRLCLN